MDVQFFFLMQKWYFKISYLLFFSNAFAYLHNFFHNCSLLMFVSFYCCFSLIYKPYLHQEKLVLENRGYSHVKMIKFKRLAFPYMWSLLGSEYFSVFAYISGLVVLSEMSKTMHVFPLIEITRSQANAIRLRVSTYNASSKCSSVVMKNGHQESHYKLQKQKTCSTA